MAGFPGGTVVTGQCFLQVGHGSGALHVDDRIQFCPARGRLGKRRSGCLWGLRVAGVLRLSLHLDVVQSVRLQTGPAEVEVEEGGCGAIPPAGRLQLVSAERDDHVLGVDVVVSGVGAVLPMAVETVDGLVLGAALRVLSQRRQGGEVLVVQQSRPPLGRVVDVGVRSERRAAATDSEALGSTGRGFLGSSAVASVCV